VRPSNPVFDPTNMALLDTVFLRQFGLKHRRASDCINLFFGEFGVAAPLSPIASAMLNSVRLIGGGGIPTQIFKTVILRVSVVMAALFLIGARAYKGRQNEGVNLEHPCFVVPPQQDNGTKVSFCKAWLLEGLSFYGPYPAFVRNLIYSFVSRYWLPVFHTQGWHNNMGLVNP